MATPAANILTKGPLSTALGQWIFISFGTFVIFTGDNGVSHAARDIASIALRLVTGRDWRDVAGMALLGEAGLSSRHLSSNHGGGQHPQQPIVIHTMSSSDRHSNLASRSSLRSLFSLSTLLQLTFSTTFLWASYVVVTRYLPEKISALLPVTRQFFDTAVTHLGNGILRVRDVLGEQMALLGIKQEELAQHQKETHSEVLGVKEDVRGVTRNLEELAKMMERCEEELGDAKGRQTYVVKGVRLLVRCVGDILRTNSGVNGSSGGYDVAAELERFSRLSGDDEEEGGDDYYSGGSGGGMERSSNPKLDYPASPILSEISASATENGDLRHFHHHNSIPSFSLSHSPSLPLAPGGSNHKNYHGSVFMRSSSALTPATASSGSTSMTPMSGTPRSSSMIVTSQGGGGGQGPENEVPMPRHSHPPQSQYDNASNPSEKVALDDVDQLLSMIRNGNGNIGVNRAQQ
mmetsp:Transcript_22503/g.46318  ORF Transcript_22503/g.46318 Transcript_22503/m.46318 type:complete len:462 (+) Transcript_22503:66-1451(+)